jgi:hypothetical protein
MNDYYPVIARAVADRGTGEARQSVYERARKAIAQLHFNQPALLDADIAKERLALEEAIREVEAEAARNSQTEIRAAAPPSEGLPDAHNRDKGQPASPNLDGRPHALSSRQAPIDDRDVVDIQAVAIGGSYGADYYCDDLPDSRWSGSLLVMTAVLTLAVLGGTFAYRAMFGGYVFPALGPITGSDIIVRHSSDTRRSNSSHTSIEAPKTVPRVISTIPISSKPNAGEVAPASAATASVLAPRVASALDLDVAASVPPPASAPVPVPGSSEPKESAAVAAVTREPDASSPGLLNVAAAPPVGDASPSPHPPMQADNGTAAEVSSSGAYAVQLSSERSADEAHASFRALRAKFPKQLGAREPIVRRTDLGAKGIYYRVMVGPFASMEKAVGMCGTLKAAGCDCLVQRN